MIAVCGWLLLVVATNCGRSPSSPAGESGAESPAAAAPLSPGASSPVAAATIESVEFAPMDPTPASTLAVTVRTNPDQLPEGMSLRYLLWANASVAMTSGNNQFALAGFKKNDLLYVDAVLLQDDREVFRKRSPLFRILNSSPEIDGVDLPDFSGPGTYAIRVNAHDADNDPIAYTLEGDALPAGTAIDPAGVITLALAEPIPASIAFQAVVRDNDQGECRQEIKIALAKKNNKEKQDEGGMK
jgi:hypothetical protein